VSALSSVDIGLSPLVSVVIPVRGKANELWFTLQGLVYAGFNEDVEVLVVDNDPSEDVRLVCDYFSRPWLRYLEAGDVKGVNYPREVGARHARGVWLLILDSHVLLKPGTWEVLRERIQQGIYPPGSLVHFGVSFGSPHVWGAYRLTLNQNFWGTWHHLVEPGWTQPYPIAATGNWSILTRCEDWRAIGGLNPEFRGYGGDEIYLQLKYWRFGGQVLLDPALVGSHWSGPRAYRVEGLELLINTAIAGRVVVGPSFLDRYGQSLAAHFSVGGCSQAAIAQALQDGVSKAEQSPECSQIQDWPRSFDDVLTLWDQQSIPC
jgi:glycosyltransferase involved in cell wall biosynthesis